MKNILDFSKNEMTENLLLIGEKKYRMEQIWNWLYVFGIRSFSEMKNLSAELQEKLSKDFVISRPEIEVKQKSSDGTIKWLLKLSDNSKIEMVYIPEATRGTLCISSQVGCTLTCSFCHTGTQRFVRNLTCAELLGQVLLAKDELNDWKKENPKLTNIVLMGMGEPLYNYENVAKALKIFMDDKGLRFAKKRITLSTSGVVPMIDKCAEELAVHLAISLHAVNDKLRNILVPLNKKYPIEDLMSSVRKYPANRHSKITFEYVMLDGVNDSEADARTLAKLIQGIPSKVNLIPFNPWPGSVYKCSSPLQIKQFADCLIKAGVLAFVRTPRGQDILAACGQLKTESERASKSILKNAACSGD